MAKLKTINISDSDIKEQMTAVIKTSDINEENKIALQTTFAQYIDVINTWRQNVNNLSITDESQIELINTAKEGAKYIVKVRTTIDKIRKDVGGEYYKQYKAVNNAANLLLEELKPIEEALVEKSNFIVNKRKAEKEELNNRRLLLLQPYAEFAVMNFDYSDMSEEDFDKTLKGAKAAYDYQQSIILKQQEEDNISKVREYRKTEMMKLGLSYDHLLDSMVYIMNDKPEVGVQVEAVIMKCSDEEFLQLLEETNIKLIGVKKFYAETLEVIQKKELEYKKWQEDAEKARQDAVKIIKEHQQTINTQSDALNKTKAVLDKIGIPLDTAKPVPDNIILTDIEKLKLLVETFKHIQYPKLTENVEYLNKTLSNTMMLVCKIIDYINERLNKIK